MISGAWLPPQAAAGISAWTGSALGYEQGSGPRAQGWAVLGGACVCVCVCVCVCEREKEREMAGRGGCSGARPYQRVLTAPEAQGEAHAQSGPPWSKHWVWITDTYGAGGGRGARHSSGRGERGLCCPQPSNPWPPCTPGHSAKDGETTVRPQGGAQASPRGAAPHT